MAAFSQKYYANRFQKIMEKSDAVRMDEKEVLKFGEEKLKQWAEEKGWVAYVLKVTSPSGNLTSISLAVIARSWEDVIAILNNAIHELTNSRTANPVTEKMRLDILHQYKERLKEVLNDYIKLQELQTSNEIA